MPDWIIALIGFVLGGSLYVVIKLIREDRREKFNQKRFEEYIAKRNKEKI